MAVSEKVKCSQTQLKSLWKINIKNFVINVIVFGKDINEESRFAYLTGYTLLYRISFTDGNTITLGWR